MSLLYLGCVRQDYWLLAGHKGGRRPSIIRSQKKELLPCRDPPTPSHPSASLPQNFRQTSVANTPFESVMFHVEFVKNHCVFYQKRNDKRMKGTEIPYIFFKAESFLLLIVPMP